jgi:hypothetical protein
MGVVLGRVGSFAGVTTLRHKVNNFDCWPDVAGVTHSAASRRKSHAHFATMPYGLAWLDERPKADALRVRQADLPGPSRGSRPHWWQSIRHHARDRPHTNAVPRSARPDRPADRGATGSEAESAARDRQAEALEWHAASPAEQRSAQRDRDASCAPLHAVTDRGSGARHSNTDRRPASA